jgi:hypothetical protein
LNNLEMPGGIRGRRLFSRLEETVEDFLTRLPPGIDALAWQQGAYQGDFNTEPFPGLGTLNPALVGTPWLFWECFPELEDNLRLQIAEAGAFYVLASVVLDHLADHQAAEPGQQAIYHQALLSQALERYRLIFPSASPFWRDFQRLEASHLAGLSREIWVQTHPGEFSLQMLTSIADGKVAPMTTTLVALSHAAGCPQLIPALEASLEHISVGSQLLDDIGDWQADVESRHLTYFLTRLAEPDAWTRLEWPPLAELETRMQAGWVDVLELKQVRADLDRSVEAVQGLDCPAWLKYVDGYRTITDEALERRVRQYLGRVLGQMKGGQL